MSSIVPAWMATLVFAPHAPALTRRCTHTQPLNPPMDPAPDRAIALHVVLEGLPDAAVGPGRDGLCVFFKGLAEAQFGYAGEELIGKPIEVLWPPNMRARYRRNLEL